VRDIDFKVAIVECAPGLLSAKHAADAEQWRQAFMKRNCRVQHRTINAADHGSAESRTRSFMVATRNGLDVGDVLGYIFPAATPQTTTVTSILDKNVKDDQHLGSMDVAEIKFHERPPRKGRGGLVELGRIDGKKHQGYRVYDPDQLGATITATGGGRAPCTSAYLIDGKPRGLTAREACRMHGLPEWFEHDTDLRRSQFQAGNSLSLPLVRELGRQLASVLNPRT
jgi:site-specific DNA-cytosine methylase